MTPDDPTHAAPSRSHVPVLLEQVLDHLARPEARHLLDGTLGAGGHAAALLDALPAARLVGLDRDPAALALAGERLAPYGERALLLQAALADAAEVAAERDLPPFDAILIDIGVSSMQLDQPARGFSFQQGGPLDMRMDPGLPHTAADLLDTLSEGELADVIYQLGEERFSRRIARAIVERRRQAPLRTTDELAELVRRAVPPPKRPARGRGRRGPPRRRIHPATRTFQALRMAVNDELGQLDRALPALFGLLAPGGRLAVIAFHSLEDRRVKLFFRERKQTGEGLLLTKKPLQASDLEVEQNPRARSAKLRVIERRG